MEMLLTLFRDRNQIQKLVERHSAGESIASDVIEEGQKVSLLNISRNVYRSCVARNCKSSY